MPYNLLFLLGRATAAALHRIGRFLCQADADERISIWSIGRQDARVFFPLLLLGWTLALAALAGAHYASSPPPLLLEITPSRLRAPDANGYTILEEFSKIVLGLAALTLIATPILTNSGRMLMSIAGIINEKFLEPRMNRIKDDIRDNMRAEVRDEVRAEVHAEVRDMVRAEVHAEVRDKVRAEVHAEVRDEVRAEGRAESDARWREWLSRNAPELSEQLPPADPPPYSSE